MIFIIIMINIVGIIDCLTPIYYYGIITVFKDFVLFFVIRKRENFKMLFWFYKSET